MLFVFLDICGGAKLISNGLSERNVNFIDDPNNVAIDFSREDLFRSIITDTHGLIKLFTLLVKYYNGLLGRQISERGMDEVVDILLCCGPFLYTFNFIIVICHCVL